MEGGLDDLHGWMGKLPDINAGHVVIEDISIDFFLQSEPKLDGNTRSRYVGVLNGNNLDPDKITDELSKKGYTISIPDDAKFGKGLRPDTAYLLANKASSKFQVVFAQNKGLTHFSDFFENADKLDRERFSNKSHAFEEFSNNVAGIIATTKGKEPPVIKIERVLDLK